MDITAPGAIAAVDDDEGVEYASWWRRFIALLIDGVITTIAVMLLFFVVGIVLGVGASARAGRPAAQESLSLLFLIGYFVIPALYFIAGNGIGGTVGKSMMGIRVRRSDSDESIGLVRAFLRYIVPIGLAALFLVPYLLDMLWPLWDSKNQSLHDKVAGSIVVRA